jgi:hypothetical protein
VCSSPDSNKNPKFDHVTPQPMTGWKKAKFVWKSW